VYDANKPLKIAFLTSLAPDDRRSWSGTIYHIAQALQKYCGEVSYIGPIDLKEMLVGKAIHKTTQMLLKKNYMYHCSFLFSKKYGKVASKLITGQLFDVIVAPSGTREIAFLNTNIPILLIEDATFALLHNYHQNFSNLLSRSVYETNAVQDLGIQKASLALYSSEWAARSAIEDYHADTRKVHVVPFGANFETPPPIEVLHQRKRSDICRLLFVGVNWERKGGDIAFETLVKLEEMGIPAELTVCGCVPPKTFTHEKMKVIPFLNKNDANQRKELEQLYITSDFLLFPTRNECYGIVVCEASAFGLPVVATNTGGVAGAISEGKNGFLMPYDAGGAEYAQLIAQVYQDEPCYAALVQSSRVVFDEKLNWDAWGSAVKQLLAEMLREGGQD